jgi:hypothetical protein
MSEYKFSLSGMALPEGQDPLGLWDVPVQEGGAAKDAVSFAVDEGPSHAEPETPTWRIALPASPETAQAVLRAKNRALQLAQHDLQRVDEQLETFDPTGGGTSFGVADELAAPKSDLMQSLARYQEREAVAFGLFRREKAPPTETKLTQEETRTYEQWNAFMAQVQRMVGHYARVETVLGEGIIGNTAVGWTGDFATTWGDGITRNTMHIHMQSVHLALQSRIALVRIVSVVATGAAGLAVKAAVPGGQLLLLPAIWKFVRDVLAELRKSWPDLKYLA